MRKVPNFFNAIYEIVKKTPRGSVATYGQITRLLGTKDARKVGWALHSNKDPKVPCHRVVNRDGRVAPNFARLQRLEHSDCGQAFDGWREQKERLLAEGIIFKDETHVDLDRHLWNPN